MDCDPVEFSGHAVRRMFERQIEKDAVIAVIRNGEIIADYPDDDPYPSFLILGVAAGRPLHVVLGIDPESKAARVITVYVPEPDLWSQDFRTRRMS